MKLRHYFKWHNNAYQGQYLLSRSLFTSNKTRWCNVLWVIMIGSENIEWKWISFPVIVSMTSHARSMSNYDLQHNIITVWSFHALHLKLDKKISRRVIDFARRINLPQWVILPHTRVRSSFRVYIRTYIAQFWYVIS